MRRPCAVSAAMSRMRHMFDRERALGESLRESAESAEPRAAELAEQSAEAWADCSGAVLAKLVADAMSTLPEVPDSLVGDGRILDLITATTRVIAWATATQAKLTATIYSRALAEHRRFGLVSLVQGGQGPAGGGRDTDAGPSHRYDDVAYTTREIAANLSMELGQPIPAAERDVRLALGLARDPALRQALAAGRLDAAQARAMVEELDQVTCSDVRRPVLASMITDPAAASARCVLVRELRPGRKRLWDLPPADLRGIIRREVHQLDPALAAARVRAARLDRHVRYHQKRDAMAELVLHGPSERMSAAYQHLTLVAHAARHKGGEGSIDQLRHDIALGWLTEGAHGLHITRSDDPNGPGEPNGLDEPSRRRRRVLARASVGTMVNITMAATTLLGLDDVPATLHSPSGPTPLPAELARRLAHDPEQATWRRVLCDPATGIATDVSTSYRPPKRMADYVKVRDGQRSRFPVGNATHLELDHLLPYDRVRPTAGGPTTPRNLASEGQFGHHLKTDGAIAVAGDANSVLTYRGRSGRAHRSWPYQYFDPAADPPF